LLAIQALWRQETQVIASQLGFTQPPGDPIALNQLLANTAEVNIRLDAASTELARSRSEMESTRSDLEGLRSQLKLNRAITARLERLRIQGGASQLDVDRQREREQSIRTTMNRAIHELRSAELRVQETALKGKLISTAERKQLYPRYSNARQQYIEASSKISDLRERINLQTLRAPSMGQVFDLQAKVGETIGSARPAVQIVPPNVLEAKIEISNKDIGLIKRGMKVDLRIESFPSTEYGSIKAWITRISADALPPTQTNPQSHFVVTARLSNQSLKRHDVNYRLRPGLAFSGLIILDSRPAISLVTDRLFSFLDSSRTIR
jgi:HlyD family secretion protein